MSTRGAAPDSEPAGCCPYYHQAVELIGKRWTGAIVSVLLERPRRFSEIAAAVPQLSDRLLSERMKELEARGLVERTVIPGPLTSMGRELEPALAELKRWGRRWLGEPQPASGEAPEPADAIV